MKKIVTLSALLLSVFGFKSNAQLSGAYPVPSPTYPTLLSVLNDLNTLGVSGPVTINLNQDETAPSGGYILGSGVLNTGADGTALVRQLTINGKGHTITAPVGTGTTDGIFKIVGTDFVTINNLNLRENAANTTATSMMEWGYAAVKRNLNDGVQTLTIQACKITLNKANTTAASGIANNGSSGIFIGNCLPTSTAALGTPAKDSGSHAGIFIFQDTIENVTRGIYGFGNALVIDGVQFNDYGLTLQGNQISNFTHHGIQLSYFNNDFIKSNFINNTAASGTAPIANSIFGIQYITSSATATNNSWTCETNSIRLTINTPAGGNYHATGIATQVYGTGTTRIAEDTVELTSTGASAQLNGIFSQNNLGTQVITKNVIQKFTTATTNAQAVIGIFTGGYCVYPGLGQGIIASYPLSSTVSDNLIDNFEVVSSTTSAQTPVYGCQDDNLTANVSNFTGNTVSNITIKGPSAVFIGYGGMWGYGVITILRTTNIDNNKFTNITATGATNGTPIFVLRPLGPYPNGHTVNVTRNKISKITGVLGRVSAMEADEGLALNFSKDTISDMTSAFHVFGLLAGNLLRTPATGAQYATKTLQINDNSFTNMSSTSLLNGAITAGVYIFPGTATGNFTTAATLNNNTFSNIKNTDIVGGSFGINATGGTATYTLYNNMVGDIAAASNTGTYSSSYGIGLQGSGVNSAYYNTVNMVSGTTAATGYGATGLMYNPAGTNTIQNNILRVNVVAGTGNNVSALRGITGAASAAPSTSSFTAGSNIYYSPTGPNNFLYVEGTTNTSLVNGYHVSGLTANTTKNIVNDTFFNSDCNKSSYHNLMKAALSSREARTYTENNLSGSAGSYAPTGTTYAEAGAIDIASVSTDITGALRPVGSSDIGAKEFTGDLLPSMNITITSSTGMDTACVFNLPRLNVTIPVYFNRVSYQWYRDTTAIAGATGTSIAVGSVTGTYTVKVYDSVTGCIHTSTGFKMTIMPPPPAFITYYDSLVFCETSAIVLSGNKGSSFIYQWYKDGVPMAGETNEQLVANTTGEYTVEINTPLGCPSMSAPIKVKVYPLPNPTIFLDGPRVLSTQKYYTYQWFRNNIKIDSFASGQRYFVLEDGAYTVEVTDSNGCTSKSTIYLLSLGVKENELSARVSIFPNPSSGKIHIDSPVPLSATLSDVTGRVILEQPVAVDIDMSPYAEGVYLLSLLDKSGQLIKIEKVMRRK